MRIRTAGVFMNVMSESKLSGRLISSLTRFVIVGLAVLVYSPARGEMDWSEVPGLSDADKTTILKLAFNLNMPLPAYIEEKVNFPSGRKVFLIRSEIGVEGLRRFWHEIYLCRIGDEYCPSDKPGVDGWAIANEGKREERWRFSDGDWFVDVELGTGIAYVEAEAIVLAVRRDGFERIQDADPSYPFDAADILSITALDPVRRQFLVDIGRGSSGNVLTVQLSGTEVQLVEIGYRIN